MSCRNTYPLCPTASPLCCAQCRFDKTHKPYLLYLPVFANAGFFSVYHKTRREKRKPLHFIPDGCRILPTNKYRGACECRLRGSSRTSTLRNCFRTVSAPDADNAAVGSHNTVYGFLQETPQKASPFLFRSCFRKRGAPNGEDFCPQTRRFPAAILGGLQGEATPYASKKTAQAVCNA